MTQFPSTFVIEFDISPRGREILERIATLEPNDFVAGLMREFERQAGRLASRVQRESLTGGRPLSFPELRRTRPLGVRTGSLRRSVIGRAEIIGGLPAIRVGILRGPALRYAGILERGGVIRPKNAKALAVPGEGAVTPAGVDRYGGPRNFPGQLRFIPSVGRGNVVGRLIEDRPGLTLDRARVIYWLLRSAKIPAFGWLRTPVLEALPALTSDIERFLAENFV